MKDELLNKVKGLSALASELNVSTAALCIGWCIKNPNVTSAILGATHKKQLVENLKALEVLEKLNPEILQRIDDIAGTKPRLPEY